MKNEQGKYQIVQQRELLRSYMEDLETVEKQIKENQDENDPLYDEMGEIEKHIEILEAELESEDIELENTYD